MGILLLVYTAADDEEEESSDIRNSVARLGLNGALVCEARNTPNLRISIASALCIILRNSILHQFCMMFLTE